MPGPFDYYWDAVQAAQKNKFFDQEGKNNHPAFHQGFQPPMQQPQQQPVSLPQIDVPQEQGDEAPMPPMLSAQSFAGHGPLYGGTPESGGYDLQRSIQNAAAYAMAFDTGGKSLATLRGPDPLDRDSFSLHNNPDGSVSQFSRRTGAQRTVAGAQPKIVDIGEGPMGKIKGLQIGPRIFDMNGRLIQDTSGVGQGVAPGGSSLARGPQAPGAAPGQTAAAGGPVDLGMQPMMRDGVQYDDNLKGDDWLAQFKPEYAEQVRAFHEGRAYPTSRGKVFQTIRTLTSRYGADKGEPFDENLFQAKKKMWVELQQKASPSTVGGSLNTAETALGHLDDLLVASQKLGNLNVFGLSAPSTLINSINLTNERKAAIKAVDSAKHLASGEIQRFYVGRGGGAEERKAAAELLSASTDSPDVLASAALMQAHMMRSKMEPTILRIEQTLGPKVAAQYREAFEMKLRKVEQTAEALKNQGYVSPSGPLKMMVNPAHAIGGAVGDKLFGPGETAIKAKRIGD